MNPEVQSLIKALDAHPRIQSIVTLEWGTRFLDEYLLNLLSDTRDGARSGFNSTVAFALMELQLMNLKQINGGDTTPGSLESRFVCNPNTWVLPKNF